MTEITADRARAVCISVGSQGPAAGITAKNRGFEEEEEEEKEEESGRDASIHTVTENAGNQLARFDTDCAVVK